MILLRPFFTGGFAPRYPLKFAIAGYGFLVYNVKKDLLSLLLPGKNNRTPSGCYSHCFDLEAFFYAAAFSTVRLNDRPNSA